MPSPSKRTQRARRDSTRKELASDRPDDSSPSRPAKRRKKVRLPVCPSACLPTCLFGLDLTFVKSRPSLSHHAVPCPAGQSPTDALCFANSRPRKSLPLPRNMSTRNPNPVWLLTPVLSPTTLSTMRNLSILSSTRLPSTSKLLRMSSFRPARTTQTLASPGRTASTPTPRLLVLGGHFTSRRRPSTSAAPLIPRSPSTQTTTRNSFTLTWDQAR